MTTITNVVTNPESRISNISKRERIPNPEYRIFQNVNESRIPDNEYSTHHFKYNILTSNSLRLFHSGCRLILNLLLAYFLMRYHVLVLTFAIHYDLFYIDIMVIRLISFSTWSNVACEHFSELKCSIWHCDAHITSWQSHRIVKSSFIYSLYSICFLYST